MPLTIIQHSQFKDPTDHEYAHPVDPLVAKRKDGVAEIRKIGNTFHFGPVTDDPGKFAILRRPDWDFDLANPTSNLVAGRASAMLAVTLDLADRIHEVENDRRRGPLSIEEETLAARTHALRQFISIASEEAVFEATVAGNAAAFYAPPAIAPADAAEAVLDGTIQGRVNAMETEEAMKLFRANPRAALAIARDPIPGKHHEFATRAWRDHKRAEDPAKAAQFDDAERHAAWGRDATRAARRFLLQNLGDNGAELVAGLDAFALDRVKVAGLDVERGTGRLVEAGAA
jgi:hypothetical protein